MVLGQDRKRETLAPPSLRHSQHGTDELNRLTHRDVSGQQLFLIESHGGVEVCLQTLGIVAVAHGQHQAVGQSDQDVPRSPGDRLVTVES